MLNIVYWWCVQVSHVRNYYIVKLRNYFLKLYVDFEIHDFCSIWLNVWDYTIDRNLRATCYTFETGATSRVPFLKYQTEIWELRAMSSWQELSLESLAHYISPLGAHHSNIHAFGVFYGVIGFWGRLLVWLHGFHLVITWVYG